MSFGFNTDVRAGEHVFHVQTEDRGQSRPIVETLVYQDGMILYRRAASYDRATDPVAASADALRRRVEDQHRTVIDDLRSGSLDAEIATAMQRAGRAAGIEVQLLNPTSWLSRGNVSLHIEILRRVDHRPEAGAYVEAAIEGAGPDARSTGTSDDQGRVRIEFPFPPLSKGNLALVIQAKAKSGTNELRFAMRPRPKTPPAGSLR